MSRAIVVGGSIGGLLVAKALARHVDEVVVVDRDHPPSEPLARRGAGQGTQVHTLLDSGHTAMERLLPGLFERLRARGGVEVDFGVGCRWFHSGSYKIHGPAGITSCVQSRPLIEAEIRAMVAEDPKISLRYGISCEGLEAEGGRIRGVRVQGEQQDAETLTAEIVILATGRGRHLLRWLGEVGCPEPPTITIPIGIGYASRIYEGMPDITAETPMVIAYGTRTRTRRHGLAFRIEGDRTLVTLMGYHGDHPPRDAAAWTEWAGTLETPDIADNIARAKPVSEVMSYRAPEQYRRHWHRAKLPEGLAVFGDAACGLDPVFGQGMSVVATQAAGLAKLLEHGSFRTQDVQRMVARKADRAWLITSIEAARYSESASAVRVPMVRVLQWFLDCVYAASAHDPVVYRAFLDVVFLNRSATWLMRPGIVWRLFRPGREVPQPPPLRAHLHPVRP